MEEKWGKDIQADEIILEKMIGEGMYGKVYKAKCRAINVAVKIPTKQKLTPQELEVFKREIQIMRNVNHPNVCLFMGAVADGGTLKIVTELMSGDVENAIFSQSNPVSLLQRLNWARDAAQGMAWLHANNPCILHRDMKPSNLLLDLSGKVKVTDFGLSEMIQQGAQVREVRPKGSPIYMAPEVMTRKNISTKVDVYSFAITMWEIFSKSAAFSHHDDYAKFARAVVDGERPPLDQLPESLQGLLAQSWAKDPEQRPSFPEVCKQLDECIVEIGIQSDVPPFLARKFWSTNFGPELTAPWKTFHKKLLCELQHEDWLLPQEGGGGGGDQEAVLPANARDKDISFASQNMKREFARRHYTNFRHLHDIFEDELRESDFVMTCLKHLFLPNLKTDLEDESVHMDWFGKVLGWLGPFNPSFLGSFSKLLREDWFHGILNKSEAESKLNNCSPGTFLVRFSTTNDNHFVISKVRGDKSKQHMLVHYAPAEHGYRFNNQVFPSLGQLLKDSTGAFKLLHPCSGSFYQNMKEPENPYT